MDVTMSLLGGGLQVGVDARQEGAFLLQMGNAKGSPDEHDNIDAKQAGCKICFAPHMTWKGFNGSKNNRTATEQIAYESLVAGSGTILLHPGMDTGDVLTNRALVPMQKNIVQALDTCVTLQWVELHV
ncbi:unnamed protein product [Sphagnum jensenii]|uniref:Uncharacterized protein n=1 Tax=Sphagnum jensenii TaxID=128206 RepID=A0ABP1AT89_9BRYO